MVEVSAGINWLTDIPSVEKLLFTYVLDYFIPHNQCTPCHILCFRNEFLTFRSLDFCLPLCSYHFLFEGFFLQFLCKFPRRLRKVSFLYLQMLKCSSYQFLWTKWEDARTVDEFYVYENHALLRSLPDWVVFHIFCSRWHRVIYRTVQNISEECRNIINPCHRIFRWPRYIKIFSREVKTLEHHVLPTMKTNEVWFWDVKRKYFI